VHLGSSLFNQEPVVHELTYSNLGAQPEFLAMKPGGVFLDVSNGGDLLRSYNRAIDTKPQESHSQQNREQFGGYHSRMPQENL
jgi:hypothetical protein